jgi:hypothetical protein
MQEFKVGTSPRVGVIFLNPSNFPVGGIPSGSITATVLKADGSAVPLVVTNADWQEISTGAFDSSGTYLLKLPASAMDVPGPLWFAVVSPGTKVFTGAIFVSANLEIDTFTRIGAPVGATISADIAAVKADAVTLLTDTNTIKTTTSATALDVTDIKTKTTAINAATFGKWQIFTTGIDANRLVMYAADGVTVLKKFDLKDSAGVATSSSPFSRLPLP